MGFKFKKRVFRVRFEDDPDLQGLQIDMKSMKVSSLFQTMGLAHLDSDSQLSELGSKEMQQVRELFEMFVNLIDDWNVEDDNGDKIEPTFENITENLEIDVLMKVLDVVFDKMTTPQDNLKKGSTGGEQSETELSLPMAAE